MAALALACLLVAAPAAAQGSTTRPWDGSLPFDCVLQQAGTDAKFPHPEADPFCVEYDKRKQNVTEGGLVQFLSLEPARVAAASPKCFYFQRDHWRGSIVQGDERTETYNWDGSYYFDKARGTGGVYVENFTFNNQTADPRLMPGFPEEYKPFFGPGRGGVQADDSVARDPACVEKAQRRPPQRRPAAPRCRVPGGRVDTGIGGVRLGMTRKAVRQSLGAPLRESLRWMRWCFDGGGGLAAGYRSAGPRARTELVLTTARTFDVRGIRVGSHWRTVRRRLRGERRLPRSRTLRVYTVRGRRHVLLVGIRRGRASFLAVAGRRLSKKALIRYVRSG